MSALHHDVSWPGIKAGLKVEHNYERRLYRPVDQRQRFFLAQSTILGTEVIKHIHKAAAAHIKGAQAGATPLFKVNPRASLDDRAKCMRGQFMGQNMVQQVMVFTTTGVHPKIQRECTEEAIAFVYEFFQDPQHTIFHLEDSKEALEDWTSDTIVKVANFGYRKMGFIQSDEPLVWKAEDLRFFGIEACKIPPHMISCVQYALLRAREIRAKELIFAPPKDQVIHEIEDHLREWGYRSVDALDQGDLVLYFMNGKPAHMGYFAGDGLVDSKLGLNNAYSHRHPIFGVPSIYGQHAVFYRKSGAKLL